MPRMAAKSYEKTYYTTSCGTRLLEAVLGGCPRKNLSSLSDRVAVRELSGDNPFPCIRSLHAPETWRAMMRESGSKPSRRWEPERSRHEAQSPAAKRPEGERVFFLLDTVAPLD